MANPRQLRNLIFSLSSGAATAALAIAFLLIVAAPQPAQAQTFNVIYTFTGGQDGAFPYAGVTMDKAGNLYGTASYGGAGYGTVYQLKHKGSGWIVNPVYSFTGGSDGSNPYARVIFGPNGALYGTTTQGGYGYGTVFNLRPSVRACTTPSCPWTETVLYAFKGADGAFPKYGDLLFDQAGNIYGTTHDGGPSFFGTVYELTPSGSGYTESVLYSFASSNDGGNPFNGVIFDNAGDLYGTTGYGGLSIYGTVFELTRSGPGWTENVLYSFLGRSDGSYPFAGLIFDQSGNLYGATTDSGTGGGGTVFELTPSGGSWTFSLVYSLTGKLTYGCGPAGTLVMDGAGNLYGTTVCDGAHGRGSVFKLTPSDGNWMYTSLHDFTGGNDGANPSSNVVFDAKGNLYGTVNGGSQGVGVVWEITP